RSKALGHPTQSLKNRVVIRPKAQHPPEALVERGERAIAGGVILDDHDGHRWRQHTSHRSDSAGCMTWLKADLAAVGECDGLIRVGCPSLEQYGADDRAAHRTAHALPGDR